LPPARINVEEPIPERAPACSGADIVVMAPVLGFWIVAVDSVSATTGRPSSSQIKPTASQSTNQADRVATE
jgi:hypothetical protein